MAENCEALSKGDRWDFVMADVPKCPHCGDDFDIDRNEAWQVYDMSQDSHELNCPSCDKAFTVSAYAKYTFSTDSQPDEDEA